MRAGEKPLLLVVTVLAFASLLAPAAAAPAPGRNRAAAAAPKLTEENLVPTELFAPAEGKRFAYPNGFEAIYARTESGHTWKITERPMSEATPTPVLDPTATPAATPTPAGSSLPQSAEEHEFLARVGYVRPTFVTIVFTDSPQAAADMVSSYFDGKSDEAARPPNLAVMSLEKDPKLAPSAAVYTREFNLGPKSGGVRRGATIVLAKGNVFLTVESFWGLKDGAYEAELDTLEKRARDVAGYLLRKM